MEYQFKNFGFRIKEIDEDRHVIRAVFSTDDVDRHGEIVDQQTWKLEAFMQNPVVLFGHNHSIPAIGRVLRLGLNEDGHLEGDVQFAVEEHDFAKTIFQLYKGGFMRAFSVGFMTEKVEIDQEGEKVTLKDNHLYELSAVNVGANDRALAKAKGINLEPLDELASKHAVEENTIDITSVVKARDALNVTWKAGGSAACWRRREDGSTQFSVPGAQGTAGRQRSAGAGTGN
jgi:uncharacterized protein